MRPSADTIFVGGTIITVDPLLPEVEALAVVGDRIFARGSTSEMLHYRGPDTAVIDLDGAALLPGFIEAHGHPFLTGVAFGDPVVDIRAIHTPTYDAALAKIRRRIAKAKPGEFLWFLGLDPTMHQGMSEPSLEMLDELAPGNPLCIQTAAFNVVYANSAAVVAAGIGDDDEPPPDGRIYKDPASGRPWKFQKSASQRLRAAFTGRQESGRLAREARAWMGHYSRAGYTTTTEMGVIPGWSAQLEPMIRAAHYPLRLVGYEKAFPEVAMPHAPGYGDDMFRVMGAKLWADGSPFAGNIWLSSPYRNSEVVLRGMGLPPNHLGEAEMSADQLMKTVMRHAALGYQIATHAQGDRAIEMTLNAYEAALAAYPEARRPFRLEHCALMTEAQIARAHALGVVSSFFLAHLYYWGEVIRDDLFGPERAARYMPAGSAARAGMRISYHTDPPLTWPNALLCLHLAVTRRSRAGSVIGADQAVDIETALRGLTIDAAYHIGMDDRIGSLSPGKYADFVMLGADPRRADPQRLLETAVLGTWLGGRPMWNAGDDGHQPLDFALPLVDASGCA